MRQKRIAVIEDLSGFGRCSLSVALPVISALQVQCCPVPTSIFSNHTAYPVYYFDDYTERMPGYIEKWKELGLAFDGIYTGFLASEAQIRIVKDFISSFQKEDTTVIVDPVMGDHGVCYKTYTEELCMRMKELSACAHVLTPNLTEACILGGMPYHREGWTKEELKDLADRIFSLGNVKKLVITGIEEGKLLGNYVALRDREGELLLFERAGESRCGTGDLFASVIAAQAVKEVDFRQSVAEAARLVQKCIRRSDELNIPKTDGVCFEEFMKLTI